MQCTDEIQTMMREVRFRLETQLACSSNAKPRFVAARSPADPQSKLKPSATAAALATCGVGGSWGHILDAANFEATAGESTECGLSAGPGGLCARAAGGSEFDVQRGDANLLALESNVLCCEHCGVRR